MIAGFIIQGGPQKVIIRVIGPALPVDGKLLDPTLELHDSTGALLETNDNWVDSPNKQAIIDTTIPPSKNLESTILRTLEPGSYTAIVRGVNDTEGVALVKFTHYNRPSRGFYFPRRTTVWYFASGAANAGASPGASKPIRCQTRRRPRRLILFWLDVQELSRKRH